jgi:DNA-binding LacI/PurR family transcriptional regulator
MSADDRELASETVDERSDASKEGPRGGGEKHSNLADIAEAAGVSISTVSRALRGSGGVSSSTIKRVQDLANNLSYKARGRSAEAYQLNCLVSMALFETDAAGFYREIIEGIEAEADDAGHPVTLTFLDAESDNVARILDMARDDCETGFLLVGIDDEQQRDAAASVGEIILVNASDVAMRYDGVTPANRRGAFLGTKHLIELGHRRIAHFTWSRRATIRDRFLGYQAALLDAGIIFDPDLVFEVRNLRPHDAADAARKALASGKLQEATGIFCASDLVAVGVISALLGEGYSVPEDFSIVGFDNTRITARHEPGLTTLSVALPQVGRESVRRLIERIRNPDLVPMDIHVSCQLVTRKSTMALVHPADTD